MERESSLIKMEWSIRANGRKEKKMDLGNLCWGWMKNMKEHLKKVWRMDMAHNFSRMVISIKVNTLQENSMEKVHTAGATVPSMKDNSKTEWEMEKAFGDRTTIMETRMKENTKMTWNMATEYIIGPTDLLIKEISAKIKNMVRVNWPIKMAKFQICNGIMAMSWQRQVTKPKWCRIQISGITASLCQLTRMSMLLNKDRRKKWRTRTRSSTTKCSKP